MKNISEAEIIRVAKDISNEKGLINLSLKEIALRLDIKSPSLYNHINNLEDVKNLLMNYGWKSVSELMLKECKDLEKEEKLYKMAHCFYDYSTSNPGVFEAMLYYNKYMSDENRLATYELYKIYFEATTSLGIKDSNANHLLRTFRSFLQGFIMMVNTNSFGNPISIKESFELSLKVLIEGMKSLENQ